VHYLNDFRANKQARTGFSFFGLGHCAECANELQLLSISAWQGDHTYFNVKTDLYQVQPSNHVAFY
jgi:hypothetical protein